MCSFTICEVSFFIQKVLNNGAVTLTINNSWCDAPVVLHDRAPYAVKVIFTVQSGEKPEIISKIYLSL